MKKLRLITEILAIIIVCLVAFVGVYAQKYNKMENQVKGYDLSKDLNGYRELVFEVSDATEVTNSEGTVVGSTDDYDDTTIETNSYQKTENKVNTDEELTEENFEKAKKVIEDRLKSFNVEDYNISLNHENGLIYLQIPENTDTDHTISNVLQVAEFKIRDSEDASNVFITNDDIKKASAVYNTTTSGTTVYLQIEFNEKGKETLKQLSTGEYATKEDSGDSSTENTTNETTNTTTEENANETENENDVEAEAEVSSENATTEENTENSSETEQTEANESSEESTETDATEESEEDNQKQIILSIDNSDMITTSFDDPIEDGILQLSMGSASTDTDSVSDSLESTATISAVINSGKMPLAYTVTENRYVNTDISNEIIKNVIIGAIIVIAVAILVLIIKHKGRGIIASIAYIGFIALYSLIVRYTNVSITLESIVAAIIVLGINYIIVYKLLKINESDESLKKISYDTEFKTVILRLLPIFIIGIIFAFIAWNKIATFGMFLFWGILLSIIYNFVVTKDMLK